MKSLEIERLRGLAIVITFVHHLPFHAAWLLSSFGGVQLFFVISGYVITRSLLRLLPDFLPTQDLLVRLEASRSALIIFFRKRFYRIVPLSIFWLLVMAILFVCLTGAKVNLLLSEIFSILTLQYNYTAFYGVGYWFDYFWSLMVECHFYLLLPVFLVGFAKLETRILGAAGVILIVSLVIRPFLVTGGPAGYTWAYEHFSTHRQLDAPFAGVLLALLFERGWGSSWRSLGLGKSRLLAFFLMGVILFYNQFLSESYVKHLGWIGLWVASSGLVALAAQGRGIIWGFPLIGKLFTYLGSRSFGIYLIHKPIIIFVYKYWASLGHSFGLVMMLMGVTLSLAEASYWLIEKPFLKKSHAMI